MKDETSIFYTKQREKLDEAKFLRMFIRDVHQNAIGMYHTSQSAYYTLVRTKEVLKVINKPSEYKYSDISFIFGKYGIF